MDTEDAEDYRWVRWGGRSGRGDGDGGAMVAVGR